MPYSWFRNLIERVATPKFFVHGRREGGLEEAWKLLAARNGVRTYREFMSEFGGVQLFRNSRSYRMEVYSSPRGLLHDTLGPMWWVGRYEASRVCIADHETGGAAEANVWEWNIAHRWKQTSMVFAEWLELKCMRARKKYTKLEWSAIERGPRPFNTQEQAIAIARAQYSWRVAGVDEDECVLVSVSNRSKLVLAYLSVKLTGKLLARDELLEGGTVIPTSHIAPGQTDVVPVSCYQSLVDPRTVALYDIPPLGPEDRDILWEFRA